MTVENVSAMITIVVSMIAAAGTAWGITRNNRSTLIDDMDQIRQAVIDENKHLRGEMRNMKAEIELTLAGLVHWRHVAQDGRLAWVAVYGADPDWYREFPPPPP